MKTLTNNLQGLQNFRRFIALGTPASSISCVEEFVVKIGRVVLWSLYYSAYYKNYSLCIVQMPCDRKRYVTQWNRTRLARFCLEPSNAPVSKKSDMISQLFNKLLVHINIKTVI